MARAVARPAKVAFSFISVSPVDDSAGHAVAGEVQAGLMLGGEYDNAATLTPFFALLQRRSPRPCPPGPSIIALSFLSGDGRAAAKPEEGRAFRPLLAPGSSGSGTDQPVTTLCYSFARRLCPYHRPRSELAEPGAGAGDHAGRGAALCLRYRQHRPAGGADVPARRAVHARSGLYAGLRRACARRHFLPAFLAGAPRAGQPARHPAVLAADLRAGAGAELGLCDQE